MVPIFSDWLAMFVELPKQDTYILLVQHRAPACICSRTKIKTGTVNTSSDFPFFSSFFLFFSLSDGSLHAWSL